MKRAKHFYNVIIFLSSIFLFLTAANAQIDFRRPSSMKGAILQKQEPNQPPIRSGSSSEEMNNALAGGLRDFVVQPDENSAVIKFKAPSGSSPVVEIGLDAPKPGPSGNLEFSSRLQLVQAEIVVERNALQQTNFKADLKGLDGGTRYYYLVTTSGGGLQTQGRFTTHSSSVNVKVVYTEITVTNDSDDGGNGELFFQFFAWTSGFGGYNPRQYGTCENPLSWNDVDPARQINEPIEIANAGNVLQLAVNGWDVDGIGPLPQGCVGFDPLARPYDSYDYEGNVAKKTVNLDDYKGEYQRVDFELTSLSQGANEGDLSFIVKGYIEISRESVR